MRIEKHIKALKESIDEINAALEDKDGLVAHQRRLAFMISSGIAELLELYFHRLNIIKEGSRIKHEWFKRRNIRELLSNQMTASVENIPRISKMLEICKRIEEKRNDLAYASPLEKEDVLKEEIRDFFEIKRLIEEETGEVSL